MRNKESQDTLDHLNAENTYTEAKTAHLKQLTENVFEEIKSRVKQTDMSVPSRSLVRGRNATSIHNAQIHVRTSRLSN